MGSVRGVEKDGTAWNTGPSKPSLSSLTDSSLRNPEGPETDLGRLESGHPLSRGSAGSQTEEEGGSSMKRRLLKAIQRRQALADGDRMDIVSVAPVEVPSGGTAVPNESEGYCQTQSATRDGPCATCSELIKPNARNAVLEATISALQAEVKRLQSRTDSGSSSAASLSQPQSLNSQWQFVAMPWCSVMQKPFPHDETEVPVRLISGRPEVCVFRPVMDRQVFVWNHKDTHIYVTKAQVYRVQPTQQQLVNDHPPVKESQGKGHGIEVSLL
ncbi:hypothetical protein KIPB_004095 [Kipferlia bialata]|uniref:Uncharacterized protein n=1 Tax=Kipferlia bialata TaxID=797122 RepID=A0A9K3GGA8_9EUKA|nr:hypothetical protein KIPB_004095 [Kipferlia bialata]|eukprot:g4095.t1